MEIKYSRNPGIWCLAIFLILISLTYFGMAIPAIILGIVALLAGILLLVTG